MTKQIITAAVAAVELTKWLDKQSTLTNVFRVLERKDGLQLFLYQYASNELVQVTDATYTNYQDVYKEIGRLLDFVMEERKNMKAA